MSVRKISNYERDYHNGSESRDLTNAILYSYRYAMDHNGICAGEVTSMIKRNPVAFCESVRLQIIKECRSAGEEWQALKVFLEDRSNFDPS